MKENVIVINGIRYELRYRRLPENARYDEERCQRCALKGRCCNVAPLCRLFPGYGGVFVTKRLTFGELADGLLGKMLYRSDIRLGKVAEVSDGEESNNFAHTRRHIYTLHLSPKTMGKFPFTYEECVKLMEGNKVVFAVGADGGERDNTIDTYELKEGITL